jgi:hypothetical protein
LRIGLQNAGKETIQLAKGSLIEDHVVQIVCFYLCLLQAKLNRQLGKVEVVFDAREAFFFRCCDQLAVTQEGSCSIMVIAGNSKNIHELLLFGQAHIVDFRRMFKPFRGAFLDPQRIGEKPGEQTEGKNGHRVQNGKDNPGLEVPDFVYKALPGFPKCLQIFSDCIGHGCAFRLEKTVDERCKNRTLPQSDEDGAEKHH